jgi:hypothetical protein
MANLNSEAILAYLSYVCGERKETPHACARSPRLAGATYAGTRCPREWSAEIRLPFAVLFFGCLAVGFARYGRSNLITPSVVLRSHNRRHPVSVVSLPDGKRSVRTLLFSSVFNHVFTASCY